jgi:hypothetical protein
MVFASGRLLAAHGLCITAISHALIEEEKKKRGRRRI